MKMLVCTDGSEPSQKATKEAARIAANFKEVDVTILTVYEAPSFPMYGGEGGSIPVEMQAQFEESKEMEGKEALQEAVKVFEEKNLKAITILKKGNPSNTIIKMASEGDFDLVVLGSRGFGGLKRIILGSVSNAVAQEAKTNVVIVKQ